MRMQGTSKIGVRWAATCVAALVVSSGVAFASTAPRVYRSARGEPLTPPSSAAVVAVVSEFLRAHGAAEPSLAALRVEKQWSGRNGVTHVRLEQVVAGLRVAGVYAKATVDAQGRLVHLIDALAAVPATGPAAARIDERQALGAATRRLGQSTAAPLAPVGRQGNTTTFSRGPEFFSAPTVERVAIPSPDGSLRTGFVVETWTRAKNLLHHAVVDGDGAVLAVERRTNDDRYNVFTEDPDKTAQSIVSGPAPSSTAESPAGWLFSGTQSTIDISGNNVHAYLDAVSNDRPDRGGEAVTNGDFLSPADLGAQPSTAGNRNVAVQNLFYLNNVIHDVLYARGFDEGAGNFQTTNFSGSGKGRDAVNAEAQDGGGTDNANFATPPDGRAPRMQMYLWNGPVPPFEVFVNPSGPSYDAAGAEFGPSPTTTGVTGDVVLVDDGTAPTSDGCEAIQTNLTGRIALIDRGTCAFTVKVLNAQGAGAIGVIVANNGGGDAVIMMGGTERKIRIPAVLVSQNSGAALKAATAVNATLRRKDPAPLMRDGDVDSDIVFHEYGHGLTWRMIGGMSGPIAGAIGEGMSDVLSIVLNDDDVVGEYSSSTAAGIRRAPYAGYPLGYGDVHGLEVHDDGEIYAAIGWKLWELYKGAGLTSAALLDDVLDGMNYTPATPTFEDMRDGIVEAVTLSGGDACRVWQAFATYGVGEGSSAVINADGSVTTTPSSALPAVCQ